MTDSRRASRGPLLILLALVLAPHAAPAATLDVSPGGTGTACTPGSPCALATANANALPGDLVRLAPGTYATAALPARSGTASARITYVGSLANPASTVVSGGSLRTRYTTIKGMRFNGNFYLDRVDANNYAQWDSLGWCEVAMDFGVDQAKDCVIYKVNVTSGNGHFTMAVPSVPVASFTIPERNTIRRCTMRLGLQQTYGTHCVMIKGAQRCVVDSNQIFINMSPNITAETDPLIAFYMKWCEFKDNRWTVRSDHNSDHLFRWRDSTMYNRCIRDTILLSGYNIRFAPSSSGSWPGSTDQNYFEGLYLKKSCVTSDVALFYQNGSRRDTLKNCVVIDSLGKAFQCLSIEKGTTLVDHCTFVSSSRYGVVDFPCGVGTFGDAWPATGRLVFTNNLIYAGRTAGGGADAGINWQFSATTNDLTSNWNLYYVPGVSSASAIRYAVNTGSATFSAPGTGQPFNSAWGDDGSSLWSDPQFANASFGGFDPRLRTGSAAIGAGSGGSDIGAFGFEGPDNTAPATVTNLAFTNVLDHSALLSWTAPGDNGFSGTATAYDVRISTSPITSGNFASATPLSPMPIPVAGGQLQTYVLLNLQNGVTYYAALRAVDDVGNWSAISNLPNATTSATDVTAPKTVDDLTASP
jgi:hypothetical protein